MLSKSQSKLITALSQKKYRNKHQLFIVEGIKAVNEFLNSSFILDSLYCTEEFEHKVDYSKVTEITKQELNKISALKNPNEALTLFQIPAPSTINLSVSTIVLDAVNDPGNLGTIIRLCDWFGIYQIVCSVDTVDCFNSKVVQATMGSLTRVHVNYTDVVSFLNNSQLPSYAAVMNGKNVYQNPMPSEAIIVMGNEANGISDDVLNCVKNHLTIPRFGEAQKAESLNVATATSILLSEFRRS